ncbi:MAG: cytochrome c oxidase assembly protein [Kiloniellaceae bacterium]
MAEPRPARNARTAVLLAGVAAGMVGLSFASVPLYRLFCQVTGLGGTTQVARTAPGAAADRVINVRFNADVDPRLPWSFQPAQRQVSVRVGEQALAFFRARNLAGRPVTGTATFNVTPLKAGPYFTKVQCFCFDEQRLDPGEEAEMAVSFFVDPAILDDRNLDEVKTITLSYTFFRHPGDADDAATAPDRVTENARPAAARRAGPAVN